MLEIISKYLSGYQNHICHPTSFGDLWFATSRRKAESEMDTIRLRCQKEDTSTNP